MTDLRDGGYRITYIRESTSQNNAYIQSAHQGHTIKACLNRHTALEGANTPAARRPNTQEQYNQQP